MAFAMPVATTPRTLTHGELLDEFSNLGHFDMKKYPPEDVREACLRALLEKSRPVSSFIHVRIREVAKEVGIDTESRELKKKILMKALQEARTWPQNHERIQVLEAALREI